MPSYHDSPEWPWPWKKELASSMQREYTLAQKTAPMFAHFLMIVLVYDADIIQGYDVPVQGTTSSWLSRTFWVM